MTDEPSKSILVVVDRTNWEWRTHEWTQQHTRKCTHIEVSYRKQLRPRELFISFNVSPQVWQGPDLGPITHKYNWNWHILQSRAVLSLVQQADLSPGHIITLSLRSKKSTWPTWISAVSKWESLEGEEYVYKCLFTFLWMCVWNSELE